MTERPPDLLDRIQWFKEHAWARAAVLLACAGGVAYGFYYYLPQFAITPAWLWPFVPDSPLAVLWGVAAIALHAWGRRSDVVDGLAFAANAQVGLWTAYVLVAYWDHFRIYTLNLNFVLFWLHLGMVALALLFVADLRRAFAGAPERRARVLGVVAAWMLLNDALDYFAFRDLYGTGCGLRPITVPCVPGMEGVLAAVTFGLTVASVGALAWLTREKVAGPVEVRRLLVRAR